MMTRRRWIAGGLAAAAALAAARVVSRELWLEERDRDIIAAIAPVMTGIKGVADADVRGVDVAISGLPLATRAQLRQLFTLLRFPPSRILIAGVRDPWHRAKPEEVARFLHAWRYSPVTQLRAGYDALHQLVLAAWYGGDASWAAIGYPGPPRIA